MSKIAIDFGTTRTKVAYLNQDTGKPHVLELGREIRSIIPSLFYIPKEGQIQLGDDAIEASKLDYVGVVRGLKMEIERKALIRRNKRKIDRIELASMLFSFIKNQCDELYFHDDPVTECILTIPPTFLRTPDKSDAIVKAAKGGGFKKIETIEEPVAAAKHWLSEGHSAVQFIFICDIGGGTSDFALLEKIPNSNNFKLYAELVPFGVDIGGNTIDESIFEQLDLEGVDTRKQDGLLLKIRQYKEYASRNKSKKFNLNFGKKRIDNMLEIILESCTEFTDQLILEMKPFIKKVDRINSVDLAKVPLLLVGGGMHIPGLQNAFEKIWPGRVKKWIDSEYATVCGAIIEGKVDTRVEKATEYFKKASALWYEKFYNETNFNDTSSSHSFLTRKIFIKEINTLCDKSLQIVDRFPPAFNLKIILSRKKNLYEEIEKAKEKWEKNKFDIVIQSCETAMKLYPKEDLPLAALEYYNEDLITHILFIQAEAYYAKKKYIKSIKTLNIVIERKPNLKSSYVLRANIVIRKLNLQSDGLTWSNVIDDINTALSLEDDNWGFGKIDLTQKFLLKYKAYALYNQKEFQACLTMLQELNAILDKKTDEKFLYNIILAKVFYEAKEYSNASNTIEHIFKKIYINENNQFVKWIKTELSLMIKWEDILSFSNTKQLLDNLLKWWIKCNDINNRDAISRLYDLNSVGTDKPWKFRDEDTNLIQDNDNYDFLLIMASIANEKSRAEQAKKCLIELWQQFPTISISEVIKDKGLESIVMQEFVPSVTINYDIGTFNNWIRITNDSLYSLHQVKLSISFFDKQDNIKKRFYRNVSKINTKTTYPPTKKNLARMNNTQIKLKYSSWLHNVFPHPGFFGKNINKIAIHVDCKEKQLLSGQLHIFLTKV